MIFHVLNRGVGRRELFHRPQDFAAFERILADALARVSGVGLLAYCLMSNHWHLELLPTADGELSEVMRWLTVNIPGEPATNVNTSAIYDRRSRTIVQWIALFSEYRSGAPRRR